MPYHVGIDYSEGPGPPRHLYALNLTESKLLERFVSPYASGREITWDLGLRSDGFRGRRRSPA